MAEKNPRWNYRVQVEGQFVGTLQNSQPRWSTKRNPQPQLNLYKKQCQPRFSLYKKNLIFLSNPLDLPWSLLLLGWLKKSERFVVDQNHLPFNAIFFL